MKLMVIALALACLAVSAPARADGSRTCRVDSGGHQVCVERNRESRERCTETCRVDSGGHRICKTVCR